MTAAGTHEKETKVARGRRESQWLVLGRCLAIIQRVQRGPADWQQLVQAAFRMEGPAAYGGTEGQALRKRFENDLHRIREFLQIELVYDRHVGGYIIRDMWRPLLDLTDEDLGTLAWLQRIFTEGAPNYADVQSLVEHLRFYLAPERRAWLMGHHSSLDLDLKPGDRDEISPSVW